jgi:spore maturation protein CgeB
MRIAYIGPEWGTSMHRANALERLGHQVTIIDPWVWLGNSAWLQRWLFRTGDLGIGLFINQRIDHDNKLVNPDLIWVNQGEFLNWFCLERLRMNGVPIINLINDDPFGGRHK